MARICPECGEQLSLKKRSDAIFCSELCRERVAQRRNVKLRRAANPGSTTERSRKYIEEHPIETAAHRIVRREIRAGRMEREDCLFCGRPAFAHHHDYTKPLEVTWLCQRHHKLAHRSVAA